MIENNIEKFQPDFQIEQDKIPYTILMNYVIQNLNDLNALGLWTYLSSLPNDWEINKQHLMNKFSKGRDYIDRLFKILSVNKLIEIDQLKCINNKFSKNKMRLKSGREFYKLIENQKLKQKENVSEAELSTKTEPFTEKPLTAEPYTANPQHTNNNTNTNAFSLNNKTKGDYFRKPKNKPPYQTNSGFADVQNQSNSFNAANYKNFKGITAKGSEEVKKIRNRLRGIYHG